MKNVTIRLTFVIPRINFPLKKYEKEFITTIAFLCYRLSQFRKIITYIRNEKAIAAT